MGIQSLKKYIEANCLNACVPVDLLKIARGLAVGRRQGGSGTHRILDNRLLLIIDGECCLDRLYGGYYSDWACGGQWNRMLQFLTVLVQTIHSNNIEVVVFFNGCLEPQRMEEWINQQKQDRHKINLIMKHVNIRAIPPPKCDTADMWCRFQNASLCKHMGMPSLYKRELNERKKLEKIVNIITNDTLPVWWLSPVCLRSCLRMALRHLNVPVMCSMDDHHQEVIAYCRENNFHGLIAEDAEYTIFDPPRYFSSEQLKLTYKGSLETKEIVMKEVAKSLNLHPKRFCIFAALLGNYLLTEEDLSSFYHTLSPESTNKLSGDALVKAIVVYVRSLPAVDNIDAIGSQVFGSHQNSPLTQEKIQKFKECVQYYLNGTQDGFLRYRPGAHIGTGRRQEFGNHLSQNLSNASQAKQSPPKITIKQKETSIQDNEANSKVINTNPSAAAKFASETEENEILSLSAYKEATVSAPTPTPDIVIEPPTSQSQQDQTVLSEETTKAAHQSKDGTLLSSSNSSNSSDSSPSRVSPDVPTWPVNVKKVEKTEANSNAEAPQVKISQLPKIPPEVMRTASERHQKGLMYPWIYQILTQGELKIPVAIEEEVPKDLPSGVILFRPLRQMVYAILFNLHHMIYMAKSKGDSEEAVQEIVIKEWVWSKTNPYKSPEMVRALQLGWGVPTVQRLWFGSVIDDKRRRMRAFLSCMRSDNPLMLKTTHVPQHLLILCCVLRYMVSDKGMRVLRKQELDAFLAQAVSPQLMDVQNIQMMQLPLVTNRGIQLASLFMQGVEHALLANDGCGAPIPLLMCCVWLFFDGKLFHHKLLKAHSAKTLSDICDGQLDQVVKVERMRAAILENLNIQFARPPLSLLGAGHFGNAPPAVPVPPPNAIGRGRGKKMVARGGQLEVAGVVVGSWGANYGQVPARSRGMSFPPSVAPAGAPPPRRSEISLALSSLTCRLGAMNMCRGYPPSNYPNHRYVSTYPVNNSSRGRRSGGIGPSKSVNKNSNKKKNNAKSDKPSKNNSNVNQRTSTSTGRGCTLEIPEQGTVGAEVSVEEKVTNGHPEGKFDDADEETSSQANTLKSGEIDNKPVKIDENLGIKSSESGVKVSVASSN
ncbi:Constitutive coactivator of PPAR-gamma-like protein 2 [Nymphon striatum]|nr:Constitutive coactivator of PPAR-gamma-like protein 2 [Nymphon striatum]